MTFRITAVYEDGEEKTYPAIGNRNDLMDAAYADGAMGVTILVMP